MRSRESFSELKLDGWKGTAQFYLPEVQGIFYDDGFSDIQIFYLGSTTLMQPKEKKIPSWTRTSKIYLKNNTEVEDVRERMEVKYQLDR